jgi:serine/threonine-protein kinase
VEGAIAGPPASLAGRYDLLEVVGRGGMATVWRSFDRHLRRQVAVKVLSGEAGADPAVHERFQREARHIASLSHPNIVAVYDFGDDDGRSFIVMEYVDGPSLGQVLAAVPVLPPGPTAAMAVDVLAALEHAHHRGIVHRDVKPANILLNSDGSAKVADFGVAKTYGESTELTVDGSFVGTASYASPEQFDGRRLGPASDLYSLGCVLYRCLAGRPPFQADDLDRMVLQHRFADPEPVRDRRRGVPMGLSAVVDRSLHKDPDDRFASARGMADALAPFVEPGLGGLIARVPAHRPAPEPGTGPPSTEVGRRTVTHRGRHAATGPPHRGRSVLIGAAAVVLVAGLATTWALTRGAGAGQTAELRSGGTLRAGQSLTSSNGRYRLTMQSDGNLVEYALPGASPVWATATSGNFGAYAVMQVDGDFVVYPGGRSAPAPGGRTPALWSSGTFGHPGAFVELLPGGATEVRGPSGGVALWSSATA